MRRFLLAFAAAACGLTAFARERGAEETTAILALREAGAVVLEDVTDPDKPALRVDFSGRATDEALKSLAALPRLRRLDLGASKVTDAGMGPLKNSFKLQKLYLYETSVGDAGLARLKDLDRLEVLDLAKTKVTNAGLKELAPLEALRVLDLSDTAVDADGVVELKKLADAKKLANLQELYLTGLKPADAKQGEAFEEKVLDLQKALPQLKVVR
jgi:internalin A